MLDRLSIAGDATGGGAGVPGEAEAVWLCHEIIEAPSNDVFRSLNPCDGPDVGHDFYAASVDEEAWAQAYLPLLREAYKRRLTSADGNWPKISELERWAAQNDVDLDVTAAYRAMPELPGQMRWYHAEYFVVPLRMLRFLPEAGDLLTICLGITKLAVAQYLDPEVLIPHLGSDGVDVLALSTDSDLTYLAGLLLSNEAFAPIGGGSYGNGNWQFGIDERWMKTYRGVETIEDLFGRQFDLAQRFAAERNNQMAVATSVLPVTEDIYLPDDDLVVDEVAAEVAAEYIVSEIVVPDSQHEFDVALSFAGEDRDLVDAVATRLKAIGVRVFYDDDNQVKMWGEDLTEYFDAVYRLKSKYAVIFISKHYAGKPWAIHERKSALSRSVLERGTYLLPVRLDDTELPGIRPTVGYLDALRLGVDGIVAAIREKLSMPSASPADEVSRVPRTPSEMHRVRESKPHGWEYLLFIGALLHGRDSLAEKYRDHVMRYGPPSDNYIPAEDAVATAERQFAFTKALADQGMTLLRPETQELAFGAPGVEGDADLIMQLAQRLTEHYEGFLDWARQMRGTSTPDRYRPLFLRLADFANQPIDAYRTFVDDSVKRGDQIPAHFQRAEEEQRAEPLEIIMTYTLDVPDEVMEVFNTEIDRLRGKRG